ncbi:MAG: hypothetical protein FJ411_02585 [Verrucomicrobia bacterium]|nr:hypothetical protein [Verrucomicrobiota bacterium]
MRKLILTALLLTPACWFASAQIGTKGFSDASGSMQTTSDDDGHIERPRAVRPEEPVAKATAATPEDKAPQAPATSSANLPAQAPGPAVSEIIQNAIRRDEELRDLRQDFIYQLQVTTERLDDDNQVIPDKTKTLSAKIKPGKDITFSADFSDDADSKSDKSSGQTRVAGGGRGLSQAQRDDDDDEDKDKQVEDAKKVNAMLDMAKIAPRYTYQRLKDDTIRDRRCFVIKFTPKKDQPFSTREEKVINKVGGTIWIDQNDFSIIQTKGKLTEEVDVAWFLATMKGLDFNYQTSELGIADIPVPAGFSMNFDLNIMGYRMAQRQKNTMTDYVKSDSATAPAASPTPPAP